MKQGKVFLIGAGPSDVGLFTLKGKETLEIADIVVYDSLVGQAVLSLIPPQARRIHVGKRAGNHPVPQEQINQILLREASAGNLVVRLKGGDPFLFGRGGEELELLVQHGIPFEIVPGVTSAISVPAYAGIPVTHRDFCSSVHIITGHTKGDSAQMPDDRALVQLGGTLVFLMGVSALADICKRLQAAGMACDMPAAVIEQGTTAAQRRIAGTISTLPTLAEQAAVTTPAIIIVGQVCALAERFAWAQQRPLGDKTVIVTRPRTRASRLSALLRQNGAEVVELPSIVTKAIEPNSALSDAIGRIKDYRRVVFTSPVGVECFFDYLRQHRIDVRILAGVGIAAIGRATAEEIERHGLLVDWIPDEYNAAALGELLAVTAETGERILLARAAQGTDELTHLLDVHGVDYDDVAIYETCYTCEQADGVKEMVEAGRIDYVAFTSASTVRGFVRTLGGLDYSKFRAVCIGESTARQAEQYGMKIAVSKTATMESMAERMKELALIEDDKQPQRKGE